MPLTPIPTFSQVLCQPYPPAQSISCRLVWWWYHCCYRSFF